jgi:hypothetical protein
MRVVRDHLVMCWVAMLTGLAALSMAGLWTWNGWLQLATIAAIAIVCTRVFAPVYYGWREPEDYPGRRTRRQR